VKHKLLLVAVAAVLPALTAARATTDVLAVRMPSGPCMADTVLLRYVMGQLDGVLGSVAYSEDTSMVTFRAQVGLTGATLNDVVVVSDSSTCEIAKVAYAGLVYPEIADTARRRNFEASLEEILVIRLNANRYLLTTHLYSPVTVWRQFLVDSAFQLVRNGFAMGSIPEKRGQSDAALAGATPRSAGFAVGSIHLVSTKFTHAVASPLEQSQSHRHPTRRDSRSLSIAGAACASPGCPRT
jgi:hypothetical protein